jgi:hypothetical protein
MTSETVLSDADTLAKKLHLLEDLSMAKNILTHEEQKEVHCQQRDA